MENCQEESVFTEIKGQVCRYIVDSILASHLFIIFTEEVEHALSYCEFVVVELQCSRIYWVKLFD